MNSLVELFNLGMMRNYSEIIPDHNPSLSIVLNVGPGEKHIAGCEELEYPDWDAEENDMPYLDNSVDQIHCYHFLEHIKNVPFFMSEVARVLVPKGHINIVVPYYKSAMQAQDLDHKSSFTEKTFSHLFNDKYYRKGKVRPMEIATNFIMGDCEANLCLVIQLRKL